MSHQTLSSKMQNKSTLTKVMVHSTDSAQAQKAEQQAAQEAQAMQGQETELTDAEKEEPHANGEFNAPRARRPCIPTKTKNAIRSTKTSASTYAFKPESLVDESPITVSTYSFFTPPTLKYGGLCRCKFAGSHH
jgi:hypothetical protein